MGDLCDVVEQQGFKPWTSALQRRRSNQLSYCPNRIILAEIFEKDKWFCGVMMVFVMIERGSGL